MKASGVGVRDRMAKLLIESGPLRSRAFSLPPQGTLGIGRDPKCAIKLPDAMVSGIHAVLKILDGKWVLVDRPSSNGLIVNEKVSDQHVLADGDVFQVGETLLSFAVHETDPLQGKTLGGYCLGKRLGRGVTGTVYRATQLSLDRTVALKILASRFAKDTEYIRGFLEEARAAGRLNHRNLVQVHDVGCDQDYYYISMEYLVGGTLEELLERDGSISVDRVLRFAVDATKALSFAEEHRIVHRDIKPANLLIDEDGAVKVGGLGMAADLRDPESSASGNVTGSPRYMAPEQARGEAVDNRADTYSLGATMYRAIAGVHAYRGSSVEEILQAKIDTDPPPLERHVPNIAPALSRVVQKMMARSPHGRFSSAIEVQEALVSAVSRKPAARGKPAASPTITRPVRKPKIVRAAPASKPQSTASPVVIAVLVIVGLIVVGLIATQVDWRGGDSSTARGNPGGSRGAAVDGRDSARSKGGGRRLSMPVDVARSVDEAGGEQALREVASIHAAYTEGKISGEDVERRLNEVLQTYPPNQTLEERVEASLEVIRAGGREKLAAEATETARDAEALIEKGNLKDAEGLFTAFERDRGQMSDTFAPARRALADAVDRLLSDCQKKLDALEREGKYAEALTEIDKVGAMLPTRFMERIDNLRAAVAKAREEAASGEEALLAAGRVAREAIARFDFEKADGLIAAAVGGRENLETFAAPLRRQVRLSREVWTHLEKVLGEKKGALRIVLPNTAGRKKLRYQVDRLTGCALRLKSGSGSKATFVTQSLLSLGSETLIGMIQSSEALEESEAREGLGLLLLLRRGPEAAKALLLDSSLNGEQLRSHEGLLSTARSIFLDARLQSARARYKKCKALDNGVARDEWDYIAADTGQLITAWREQPGFHSVRESLRELYKNARVEALLLLPPEEFFHAKTVKFKKRKGGDRDEDNSILSLTYDFSTEEQLQDFNSVEGGRVRWLKPKKAMEFSGEVRFLDGEPFQNRLSVEGQVPAGGFDTVAPNLNIALWTDARDSVTGKLDLSRENWRRRRNRDREDADDAPVDYVVLGMGYKLEVDLDGFGRGFGRLVKGFLPSFFKEAVFAIFFGGHGNRLHKDLRREKIIWDMPVGSRLASAVRFNVLFDGKSLKWAVNGRSLPFDATEVMKRVRENAPYSGSVTFFSNDQKVAYSKLIIEGLLDPEWLRSKVTAMVEEELESLDFEEPADGADEAEHRDEERETDR